MAKYSVISADSHFVEPPGMWAERLDKKFRDRAPHTVKGLQGREGEFFVCENISPLPVAAFFGAGVPSQELPEHNKKGFDQAPASVWDPAARIKDQDLDGVKAEVIYTSMGMPLSLHIGTGRRTKVDFFHQLALQASTIHHEVERSLAVFVLGGVLERFPQLRLVSAENDVAWMAYFLWRLDFVQGRLGALSPLPLTMKPSEYIKRQVYATFINEPVFVHLLQQYGADNIMWSSDYPHTAAIWPRSQQFIEETFGGLSEDDRRKIVHDTAARVYGITE